MAKENNIREQYESILGKPLPYFETVCFRFGSISMLHQFNWLALQHNTRGLLYDANENFLTGSGGICPSTPQAASTCTGRFRFAIPVRLLSGTFVLL